VRRRGGLGSVRLALLLFFLLIVSSAIGTLVPQGGDPSWYQQRYGKEALEVLRLLKLTDLFHSWWFISLLVLLAANLIACSWQRLPSLKKAWSAYASIDLPEGGFDCSGPDSIFLRDHNFRDRAEEIFQQRGYRLKWVEEGRTVRGGAVKGQWSRMASYLVHLGVLLVLMGAGVGAVWGFRGFVAIPEGETVEGFREENQQRPRKLGFQIRCENFEATFYPGTDRPQDYRSELVVLEEGQERTRKVIRVNDPLCYRGIQFSQASFGLTGEVKSVTLSLEDEAGKHGLEIKIPPGRSFPVEGTDYRLQVLRFLPDFALDDRFVPFSRSREFRNPAAQVEVRKGDRILLRTWVFGRDIAYHGPRQKGGVRVWLSDYEPVEYTGLQVGYDPGIGWVWGGFVLVGCGVLLSLLGVEKRLWIAAVREEEGWRVQLKGLQRRGSRTMEVELAAIRHDLQTGGLGAISGQSERGR